MGDILQPTHLLFVLVVALLVLGPKRLPEVGRALGRGLRDFRSAISGEERPEPTISQTSDPASSPTAFHDPTADGETIPAPAYETTPAYETPPPQSASVAAAQEGGTVENNHVSEPEAIPNEHVSESGNDHVNGTEPTENGHVSESKQIADVPSAQSGDSAETAEPVTAAKSDSSS